MLIRQDDLDPEISRSLGVKIQALYHQPNKTADEMSALSAQHVRRPIRPRARTIVKGILAGAFGGLLSLLIPGLTFLWGTFGTVTASLIVIGYWIGYVSWLIRLAREHEAPVGIRMEGFSRLVGALALTPAERAYCDAIVALADENCPLDDSTAQQVLDRINAVARQLKRIDGSLEYFERSGGGEAIARLESERSAIAELLSDCADSTAREDLEESLALCDSRLGSVRSSGTAIERLTAQKTLLTNSLQTTAASLARLQTASAGLDSGEMGAVTNSLAQAAVNIEATERALHEVATISSS